MVSFPPSCRAEAWFIEAKAGALHQLHAMIATFGPLPYHCAYRLSHSVFPTKTSGISLAC
jgi:hypothetical protein